MASEDVLLIVKNVKVKKSEGRLYLMGSRMAWMQASSDTFSKSYYYADIRVQKISPDTKDKVQLQIVMHDGSAMTFQFAHPGGRGPAQQDREEVKELLQQLLPKFRKKVNSELEEKNKMLKEDPELFQLYKDLVVSGIMSSDEFWNNRKNGKNSNIKSTKQEIGVSGGFLSDIKSTDGCNGLKYNLTADTIEAIFRTYPAVQKKHAENVPHNLSESDFWTRFFQSHYFHRDRTTFAQKEIFAECAKHDEKVMQEEKEKKDDPLVDLSEMSDGVLGDGYGLEKELDKSALSAAAAANSSLIRRFNHHSTMVLKAADKHGTIQNEIQLNGTLSPSATLTSKPSSSTNSTPNGHSAHQQLPGEPPTKKAKIKEKLELEDLGGSATEQQSTPSGASLRLTKMDRYLHGPTPVTTALYKTTQDVLQAHHQVLQDTLAWTPDQTQVLPGTVAVTALGELSPGGVLMQGYTQQQLHQLVPQEVQQELKNLYNALCELLRHFWSCFPANTPFLEEKVVKMRTNLEKFQFSKINPMKERLAHAHYNITLCGHLEDMIGAAFNKFSAWQARKSARR